MLLFEKIVLGCVLNSNRNCDLFTLARVFKVQMTFLKFNQRTRILRNPNRYVSRKVKTMSLIIFKFHAHVFSRPLANCWHNFRIFERTTFIVQFYVLLHELKVRRVPKRSRKNNTFTLRPKLQKIKQKDRVGR